MAIIGDNYSQYQEQQAKLQDRNPFSDLIQSVNGIWANYNKNEVESQVDTSNVEQTPFTEQALIDKIKDEPDAIRRQLAGATSWADLARKRAWAKDKLEAQQNAQQKYGTLGLIAAGVTAGLVDYDAPLAVFGGEAYKGTKAAINAMGISERVSAVLASSAIGGAYSVTSNSMYNYVADEDNSNMDALVTGALLGGGLGLWLNRVPATRKVLTDDKGVKQQLTDAEQRALQLKDEQQQLDTLTGELNTNQEVYNNHKTMYEEAKTRVKQTKQRLKEIAEQYKPHFLKEQAVERTELRTKNAKLKERVKKLESDRKQYVTMLKEADAEKGLAELKPELNNAISEIDKELELHNKKIKEHNHKIQTISGKVKGHKELKGDHYAANNLNSINLAREGRKLLESHEIALNEHTNTMNMHKEALKGNLAPRLKHLKKLVAKHQTQVNYLQEEIEKSHKKIQGLAKIADTDVFKDGISFGSLNRLFISPKMKLWASNNKAVAGLASLLTNASVAGKSLTGKYIKNTRNAETIKDELAGRFAKTFTNKEHTGIIDTYFKAIEKGEFTGSFEEWQVKVNKNAYEKIGKAIKEQAKVTHRNRDEIDYEELRKQLLDEVKIKYDSSELDKATKTLLDDYYGYFGKRAHEAGMDRFGKNTGIYIPHIWDGIAMAKEGAVDKLVQAQINYANHFNLPVDIDEFTELANSAMVASQDGYQHLRHILEDPLSPTTDKTSRTKARKIQVFEDEVADLLSTDLEQVMKGYEVGISGRIALKEVLGYDNVDDIMHNIVANVTDDPKEIARFRAVIKTILGIQEVSNKRGTFSHNVQQTLTKIASLAYMPGFALPALTEITNAIATTGFKGLMQHNFSSIETAADLLRKRQLSNRDFNDLVGVANIGESRMAFHSSRMDGDTTLNSTTAVHNLLDKANHWASKAFGMLPVTEASRILTGASGMNWLLDLSRNYDKLSMNTYHKLARLGLDAEDMKTIKEVNEKYVKYDEKGRLQTWNMEEWPEDIRVKVRDAIYRHIEATIINPNGSSLPMWLTDPDSWIAKITMQFMRFPVDSWEKFTLRGISEFDGNLLASVAANAALWYMVTDFRDAIKTKENQRYIGPKGESAHMMDVLSSISLTGGGLSMVDKAFTTLTGTAPGMGYTPGQATSIFGASGHVITKLTDGKLPGLYGVVSDHIGLTTHLHNAAKYLKDEISGK